MQDKIEITSKHEQLAKISEALAHPTRVAILDYILSQESCLCKDITKRLPIVQSSVSQHLKKLKAAGLIFGDQEGTKTCYCANGEVIKAYRELLDIEFSDERLENDCYSC